LKNTACFSLAETEQKNARIWYEVAEIQNQASPTPLREDMTINLSRKGALSRLGLRCLTKSIEGKQTMMS